MKSAAIFAVAIMVCVLSAGCSHKESQPKVPPPPPNSAQNSVATISTPGATQPSKKPHTEPGRAYDAKNGFSIVPPEHWRGKGEYEGTFLNYIGAADNGFTPSFNVSAHPDDGTPIENVGTGMKDELAGAVTGYKHVGEGFSTIDGKKSYWACSKYTTGHLGTAQIMQYIIRGSNGTVYVTTFTASESTFAKYRPLFEKTAMTAVAGPQDIPDQGQASPTTSAPATAQASKTSHVGPGRAYDAQNGFSILPPEGWASTGKRAHVFMAYRGPVEDGFAVGLSLGADRYDGSPIETGGPVVKKALAGMATGYKAVDEGFVTIDGKKSYWHCCKLTTGSKIVQCLQYAIPGGNGKVYFITCTALESSFAKYHPIFEAAAMTVVTD